MTGAPFRGGSGAQGDRPAPLLLPGGDVVVPAAVVEELGAALDRLEAYERGTPPPRRKGGLTRGAAGVRQVAWVAALEFRAHLAERAACAAVTAPVLVPAQPTSKSRPEELTTEQAATILGVTEARIRQLAAAGAVEGRKAARNTWLISSESVRAYRDRRGGRHGHNDGTEHRAAARRSAA
ncbi:helix-turn-helix domain-containing protein [Streptomyces mirabilis]|uniref:helix-turn-helix domain-containing protein n=1 Tax=Streptomyces sp. NPDC005388 TaxID=3156717 RepID=UPI0033BCBA8C